MKRNHSFLLFISSLLLITSCNKDNFSFDEVSIRSTEKLGSITTLNATSSLENFEVGNTSPKTAYDVSPTGISGDDIILQGKSWNLFDALIGNLATDKKNGAWSARIRNAGKITSNFDFGTITSVKVKHASFGTDGSSQWGLWYSTNGGASWAQSGANQSTTSTLQEVTFNLNTTTNTRIEIRKVNSSTRINIDDIIVDGATGSNPNPSLATKKFLFDATKRQNAGNADWQIDADGTESVPMYTGGTTIETKAQRFPTPSYTGITSTTPESYWKGGLSAWAVELVKNNQLVETLPRGTAITYGNNSNPQDLSNYDVYVVVEPNELFTSSEKTAIMNFVQNGGGLILIADHTAATTGGKDANGYNPSDRDGDGYDSPRVINDLMSNNGINNNNPFGFQVDFVDISEKPTSKVYTGTNAYATKVLNGYAGVASKLAFYNGTTATLYPTANNTVQGLFWRSNSTVNGNTGVMALLSTYGNGRIVFVGDSSPADDGTGDTNDVLHNGWSGDVPSGYTSHPALHLNASFWVGKLQ